MKRSFGKRLFAITLVLTLLLSIVTMGVLANTTCANGSHTPGDTLNPANWNNVTGGYVYPYYICTKCGSGVDADGNAEQFVGATNGCSGNPSFGIHPSDGNPCTGTTSNCSQYLQTHYHCLYCGCPVDANGMYLGSGACTTHTPGQKHDANYTSCTGGYNTEWYVCQNCGIIVDQSGVPLQAALGTGHTKGTEEFPADYTPCGGGFKVAHYECTDCHQPIDAQGNIVNSFDPDPNATHTKGTEEFPADYTPCGGGFKVAHYECTDCHRPIDAQGNLIEYFESTGAAHVLVQIPGKAPSYEEQGYLSFWKCKDCGATYFDAAGTKEITDGKDILLSKLQVGVENIRLSVSNTLTSVPTSILTQYTSVAFIEQSMVSKMTSASDIFGANSQHKLLDLELQMKNEKGDWVSVTDENFPEGGVSVLLPYPEGTDKDTFDFAIAHMITNGSRAGEIEILQGTPEANGIRVTFTSMSPVVILYQQKAPETTPPAATTSAGSSTTAGAAQNITSPQTGDASLISVWLSVLLLCGATMILLGKKRRTQ